VTELADAWLGSLTPAERAEVEVMTCGPHPMLVAVAALARRFGVPCQVSLEENMACGVGGCAGCTVLVQTPDGPAMKRVCVDGPVFDAATIFSH
jgi:dihydroorotate dehydrogenase electron transfer subunit